MAYLESRTTSSRYFILKSDIKEKINAYRLFTAVNVGGGLLGCNAVWTSNWVLAFQWNLLPVSSEINPSLYPLPSIQMMKTAQVACTLNKSVHSNRTKPMEKRPS
jgi:hypothetical protein